MARAKKETHRVTYGSGNVYADFGDDNSEEMLLKAKLSILIGMAIKKHKLTQKAAAKIMGIDQPKVSAIINGRFEGISIERLMRFLQALGVDIFGSVQRELEQAAEQLVA